MGIASLVLGIVGLVFSFIPCLGTYGIFLTIPGIVFGAIGIAKAAKNNGAGKGLAIAGLVCSIIGSVIAGYQWYVLHKASSGLSEAIEDISKEIQKTEKLDKAIDDLAKEAQKLDKEAQKLDK